MENYMLMRSGSAVIRRKSNRNYLFIRRCIATMECAGVTAFVILTMGFMFVLS